MPLYEYQCPKCGHIFEQLASFETVPPCPACGASQTEKRVTCCARHRTSGGAETPPVSSGGGCGGCMGGNCASCGR